MLSASFKEGLSIFRTIIGHAKAPKVVPASQGHWPAEGCCYASRTRNSSSPSILLSQDLINWGSLLKGEFLRNFEPKLFVDEFNLLKSSYASRMRITSSPSVFLFKDEYNSSLNTQCAFKDECDSSPSTLLKNLSSSIWWTCSSRTSKDSSPSLLKDE